jgi:quercetin dioxygenase-like cupin family protein
MKILSESKRNCRKGPEAWFTGAVWIDEVVMGAPPSRLKTNRVTFAPEARTAWHTHPVGQALHVLSGVGLVQCKGEAIQQIQSGDSVWIEADELHWHGAAPGRTLVHLAMQEVDDQGVDVVWLDHVTDDEYTGKI